MMIESMKIKVGNKIYDGNKEPVMVTHTNQDKKNIANMLSSCTKYCMYPTDKYSEEDIKKFMDVSAETRPGRMGGNKPGSGPGGKCVCPNCGYTKPHVAGEACFMQSCAKCGTKMRKK